MTIQNGYSAPVGSSANNAWRVWTTIPKRWFAWTAPLRDALIGGLSDAAAACYSFYAYAKLQTRIATATGPWLDLISYDFLGRNLPRGALQDPQYRALILATILQERVTRAAMVQILTKLNGSAPWIFEPWNTGDTGSYGGFTMGYGVGHGGWGNMNMPAQALMQVKRQAPSGVPNVNGYGSSIGGYGHGAIEWIGPSIEQVGLTDAQIYQVINQTRPTSVAVWVAFVSTLRS
ncbi:hypothetical protein [Bradyrhizobium sp. ORS 86]|uniref:hypothetical protein n=1 Tax=Bradyrhizobium sp. ORS 86 TaxID=1685970 RepID=UPI00388CF5CF